MESAVIFLAVPIQTHEKDTKFIYIETAGWSGKGDPLAQSNAHKFVSNPVWKVAIDVECHSEVTGTGRRSSEVRRYFITAPVGTLLIALRSGVWWSETGDHEAREEWMITDQQLIFSIERAAYGSLTYPRSISTGNFIIIGQSRQRRQIIRDSREEGFVISGMVNKHDFCKWNVVAV